MTTPRNRIPHSRKGTSCVSLSLCAGVSLMLGTALWAPDGHAQTTGDAGVQGVAGERKPVELPGRKDGDLYEALGWRRGSFLILPHVRISYEDDDNVLADNTDVVSDNVLTFNPGFYTQSLWNTHEVEAWGDIFVGRYDDLDSEDFDDWRLGASGRIDMDRSRFITLSLEFGEEVEDRGDPSDPGLGEPTSSDFTDLRAGWYHQFNRVYYRLGAQIFDENYKDVTVNDVVFNNDDRDFDRKTIHGEVGYEFQSDYWAFARLELEDTDYDQDTDDRGINRDSSGESLLLGVNVKLEDRLDGSVYLGRRSRDYDRGSDVSGTVIGASMVFEPSQLTKIRLSADGRIRDAVDTDTDGYFRTRYGVSVEHELMRNVILDASLGWYKDDYDNIDRNDDGTEWSIGATYLPNRWARIGLEYAHDDRDSDGIDSTASNSYDRDVIRLTVEFVR